MKRILVIDDDETVRRFIRNSLELAGFTVEEAADGWSGMQAFYKSPSDMVVTDIFMPGKEGLDIIDEISEEFPEVKTIAISGGGLYGKEYALELAMELGAHQYLAKPFSADDILEAVYDLFGFPDPRTVKS